MLVGSSRGVTVKVLDYSLKVREFEIQRTVMFTIGLSSSM